MRLETKRLILRKPKLSDWKDVVEGVGDMKVARNTLRIPYPYKKKHAFDWLKRSMKKWGNNEYAFLIELKSEKKVIGSIHLMDIEKQSGIAETGSWINLRYQRKGYITEAKIAVNEFAFNRLKLRKLCSNVFEGNSASNATQLGVGYKLEGIRKKHSIVLSTGKLKDVRVYGLFKEDWKKNLPKVKKRLNEKIKRLERK